MATNDDYVPSGIVEFFNWQAGLISFATSRRVGWGITDLSWDALLAERDIYVPLYNAITHRGTRTPADVEAHKNERVIYEKMLRDFVQQWLAINSLVTDANRVSMSITVHTDARTPRPAIVTAPNPSIKPLAGARIQNECRVESDSSKASMHPDADAIEMRYAIGTTPPVSSADCPNVIIRSKARFVTTHNIVDAGKKIYAFYRYINTTDDSKNGPFSTIVSTVITD